MTCSIAITINDIINGNRLPNNDTFFVGVAPFIISLWELQLNIGNITQTLTNNFNLTNTSTILSNTQTTGRTFSSSITNLPTNSLQYGDANKTLSLFPNEMNTTKTEITNIIDNISSNVFQPLSKNVVDFATKISTLTNEIIV
jgi:hypothetical protein